MTEDSPSAREAAEATAAGLAPLARWQPAGGWVVVEVVPISAFLELSAAIARRARSARETEEALDLLAADLLGAGDGPARRALAARTTNSHLSHDLHYYKAKFFPRMARSLLNAMTAGNPDARVVDNFTGSGTTLLEAATLGLESTGYDVDPLSVLISRAKVGLLSMDAGALEATAHHAFRRLESPITPTADRLEMPSWLSRNRRMTRELAATISHEVAVIRAAVTDAPAEHRDLLNVLISDAVSRRVRLRFLGTGVGRFSLTVAKTPMPVHFERSLRRCVTAAAVASWLRRRTGVHPARAEVVRGDARHVNRARGGFDALLTSPPYLPASSGRETYARARALPLLALGLADPSELEELADTAVGSMGTDAPVGELSPREREAVEWLGADELRAPKAAPTARYFLDMRATFKAMTSLLNPGAPAVVVSGKQSTFYEFASRRTAYVVPAAELLAEEAERAGFAVEGLQDLELAKSNMNARPRSLDPYYETLILLRAPAP